MRPSDFQDSVQMGWSWDNRNQRYKGERAGEDIKDIRQLQYFVDHDIRWLPGDEIVESQVHRVLQEERQEPAEGRLRMCHAGPELPA